MRALTLATVLALAATGLTACSSKVGQAAVVGSQRLSINDVGKDVKRGTQPYADQQTGATVYPASFVVQAWVEDQLFTLALKKREEKVPVAATDRRSVAALLTSAIGSDATAYFRTTYEKLGYTAAFGALVEHQQESIILLAHTLEPTVAASTLLSDLQSSQALNDNLLKSVTSLGAPVSVSKRYGVWSPTHLALDTTGSAGVPSFVKLGSDSQVTATTTPSQ
ncbi:MAG: hypothetical protein JWQ77_762 [Jatrophihabitans sp.]|nr:hypothetical protein [Jatrophihabitans sp.]